MFFIPAPYKIEPYYKKRSTQFRSCDGTPFNLDTMSGWNLTHETTENMWGECFIPDTFKVGTGIQLIVYGATQVLNETGSEKIVVLKPTIYRGRAGVAGEVVITPDKTPISIPIAEPAKTIHKVTLNTISGLQKGDFFTYRIQRFHTDEDDTWDAFWWVSCKVCMRYIADKIGVIV